MQCADSGGEVLAWFNTVWPKCISVQLLQEAKLPSAMLWGFLWPLAGEIVFKAQFPAKVSGNFPPGDRVYGSALSRAESDLMVLGTAE